MPAPKGILAAQPACNKYHYLYVDIIHLCTSIAPAACCACGWLLRLRLAAVPEEAIARQYICIELLLFVQAAEAAQLAHDVAAHARLMELFRLIIELVRIYNNTGRWRSSPSRWRLLYLRLHLQLTDRLFRAWTRPLSLLCFSSFPVYQLQKPVPTRSRMVVRNGVK